jgi:hypothetical protein
MSWLFYLKNLFIIYLLSFVSKSQQSIEYQPTEISLASALSTDELDTASSKCEPLNTNVLQLCKGIAYNETRFPNFMKQKSQQEAAADTQLYLPLIRINCSPVLKLFLCSLYAPPCVNNYTSQLRPCREMCEKAKRGCEDFMKRFSFSWPEYIDCWRFPSFNGAEACISDETYSNSQFQQNKLANSFTLSSYHNNNNNNNNLNENTADSFLSSLNEQQHELLFKSLGI